MPLALSIQYGGGDDDDDDEEDDDGCVCVSVSVVLGTEPRTLCLLGAFHSA